MISPIVFICFAAATFGTHPLLPMHMHLVKGMVVDEKPSRAYYVNRIRIDHVYGREKYLVAREFSANSTDHAIQGNTRPVVPRLRVGESGIWVVSDSNSDVRSVDLYNYVRWPIRPTARPDGLPSYETIEAFADNIERVSRLSRRDDAVAALERLTMDANPYISSWAISRLSPVSVGSGETIDFLERLVGNTNVPIQGQVELDKAQLGLHGPRWGRSEARFKLFQRWFASGPSERDAHLVVTRLDLITQHADREGFPQDEVLRLVTLLVKNNKFPLSERQRAGTMIASAARRSDNDEKVFETVVELVSSDLTETLRAPLAAMFLREFKIDDARRAVLKKLRDDEKTEAVKALLNKALARPNA